MAGVGVKELMTPGVPTVAPETSIREAMRRLEAGSAGLVAVCDRGRLVGTLTDREVTNGWPLSERGLVADVLQPDLSYCFEDTDVDEAERLMRENGLERIVVLDRRGRAVGTLALGTVSSRRTG